MNIYAKKGDKVTVTEDSIKSGYKCDIEKAEKYLKVGNIYTVEKTNVFSSYTEVYLQEFPDIEFNSVQFIDSKILFSNN